MVVLLSLSSLSLCACVCVCVCVCVFWYHVDTKIWPDLAREIPSAVAFAVGHSNAVNLLLFVRYLFLIALLVGSFCLLMQFKMSL